MRVPDSWLLCLFARQSLITFVNKHLNKLNLEVTELETQVCGAQVNGASALGFQAAP
jgi:hypothetical protein